MKTRKYIYLVLGILFVLFDFVIFCGILIEFILSPYSKAINFIYIAPFILPTILFFYAAYRLHKKMDGKSKKLENAFMNQPLTNNKSPNRGL